MTTRIDVAGGKIKGELAAPKSAGPEHRVGGIVVVQEWFGLNAHIKSLVDRLADEGFVSLAPDLYHGKIAKDDAEAASMMHALDFGKAVSEIGAAVAALKERPECNGKVAVLGFCLGGALSIASACGVPGLAAVVAFYGIPDVNDIDLTKVTAPILAHFAKNDEWATPAKAQAVKAKLDALGKPMTLHLYDAGHAFMRDSDPTRYDAASAKTAWDRTLTFLNEHLR